MSLYKTMAMEMARYNRWQNGILFGLCDGLDDAELKCERGIFFCSLFGTLNHILHVDRVLMDYIRAGAPPENFDPSNVAYKDYLALREARHILDREIQSTMDNAAPGWFEEVFEYHSDETNGVRRRPRALFINQMFNHQTHHRAQATCVLHTLGLDYGSTDMPFNPLSQS